MLGHRPGRSGHAGTGITVFVAELLPVPEPSTVVLFGGGLAGLAGLRRRRRTA